MKTYIKFISLIFLKSLLFVFLIMTSLVFILNLLSELEFLKMKMLVSISLYSYLY